MINQEFLNIIENTDRIPIFVDLNNLLYRNFYVFNPDKFKSAQGLPNGHLFGLCQNIRTMDKLNYEIFLCEDSKCSWRKSLTEDYKANRDHSSESGTQFWKDYPKIRDLISDLDHAHTLLSEGFEADDLMYTGAVICDKLKKKNYIFSADKDLMQAITKYTSIVHKVTLAGNEEVTLNSKEYLDKFPVEPKKLPLYRAFKGDASDNLEAPVKRLPKDLLLDLVDYLYEHNNLSGYKIQKKSHEKWIKQLVDNWNKYSINYKVMKLNPIDFEVVKKSEPGSYMKVCNDYDLFQFLKYNNELHNI